MKTKILVLSIVLAVFTQVNVAQDKKVNFGFKVAPAISWLGVDELGSSSDGSVAKFNWGFIGAYNFSENFSFVSGFNVNSFGGKYKTDGLPMVFEAKYSEFQIPAIFQMKTNEIGSLKYFVQIGLAGGYVFKAKNADAVNIDEFTNNIEASYIVSAGAELPLDGGVSFLGQVKFNGGLTNIVKDDTVKANFVELGLGILF